MIMRKEPIILILGPLRYTAMTATIYNQFNYDLIQIQTYNKINKITI